MNERLEGIPFHFTISGLSPNLAVAISAIIFMTLASPLFASSNAGLAIEKSWIRQAPPNTRMLVAYFELNNTSDIDWTLVSVNSTHFKKIEIHRSILQQGIASMEQQRSVKIPAHRKIIFKSGSFHLMLINPVKRVKTGATVALDFVFDNGNAIRVYMKVLKRKKLDKKPTTHSHP